MRRNIRAAIIAALFTLQITHLCSDADTRRPNFTLEKKNERLRYGLYVKDGSEGWSMHLEGGVAGTTGMGLKTDAFTVSGIPFDAQFRIYVEDSGWLEWVPQGTESSGFGKRLEAIQFRFPSGIPPEAMLFCRVHLEGTGWTKTTIIDNMTIVGTTGQGRRLEAFQLSLGAGALFRFPAQVEATVEKLEYVEAALRDQRITRETAIEEIQRAPAGISANCALSIVDNGIATMGLSGCIAGPAMCVLAVYNKARSLDAVIASCKPPNAEFDPETKEVRFREYDYHSHKIAIERYEREGTPYRAPAIGDPAIDN